LIRKKHLGSKIIYGSGIFVVTALGGGKFLTFLFQDMTWHIFALRKPQQKMSARALAANQV
jgi:hypothetical protein